MGGGDWVRLTGGRPGAARGLLGRHNRARLTGGGPGQRASFRAGTPGRRLPGGALLLVVLHDFDAEHPLQIDQ